MILIEPFHLAVRDIVLTQLQVYREYQLNPDSTSKPSNLFAKVADFDGVLYTIVQKDGSNILSVLSQEYGKYLKPRADTGSNVTLEFDCEKLPDDIESIATKAALLRRNCFASVFEHFFDYQVANANNPSAKIIQGTINFRSDETMFVQAMSDRVTVIFSTRFKDADDVVLGKVFLQEFSEAKRRFDGAPQVIYQHRDPPKELQGTGAASGDNVAYVTFVLSPRHTSATHRGKTIDLIHLMRTYMHYHIKCMKAYLQMRMRAKTADFLKILNRAQPAADAIGNRSYTVNVSDSSQKTQMLSASASFRRPT